MYKILERITHIVSQFFIRKPRDDMVKEYRTIFVILVVLDLSEIVSTLQSPLHFQDLLLPLHPR